MNNHESEQPLKRLDGGDSWMIGIGDGLIVFEQIIYTKNDQEQPVCQNFPLISSIYSLFSVN